MTDRPESDERLRRAAALEEEAARLRAEAATPGPAPRQPESGKHRDAALLDSAMQVAVVVTDPDGRVTDWNSGAERLLGWTARDMQGRSIGRLFTPEDRAAGRPESEMRLALTEERAEEETWHLREGGSRIRVAGEMRPLRDGEGRHVGYVKILRDRMAEQEARMALAGSEQRYRALFEAVDDGFCIIEFIDGPHGPLSDYVHIEANTGYERHTGIRDIVGKRLREIAPDEAEGWLDIYGGVLRTGTPIRFERSFVAVGRQIEVSAARVEPQSRRQVSVLFRDITERKRAEAALRQSEEQFRVLAEAIPNHVWAARPDGDLTWFNAQTYAYTGLPSGHLEGLEMWRTVVHPEDVAAAAEAWAQTLATGTVYQQELRLRRADGEFRWFLVRAEPVRDASGAITLWVGTDTDIDEGKRRAVELERLVAEHTADRNALWQLSRDLMLRCTFDGLVTAVNPAWTEILGWREEELIGRNLFDFVHPQDRLRSLEGARELSEGTSHARFDNRYRTRDGSYRWIAWSTRFSEGLINAVGRDVTAEREQAETLARTEEALRQAQKMEAVGQLTGGLAHDFNNMLAGIVGSLELMQTRMLQGRTGDLDRYIAAAQGAAKRAAALTHRLLAFSRRQTLDPKPTDVNRLVAGMEELVRRTVGPSVDVEVVAAGGLWPTLVDPSQLENALLNLCINARDAMPEGGRIVIETCNRWLDHRSAAERNVEPGQYVSLCVSDNGTGMAPDIVAKAFDPFFTTKPLGEGTGLGLSMIYGFVRQSGGQARIYSEVGQGTMVCLYLPRHRGEAETADEGLARPETERARAGETVLVVDDEPTVRMLVSEVLEDLGYAAIEAGDGPSGLKILQSEARIDLLITDVGLPGGMNGRQMADAARAHRPDLKVLFITGYAENAALNHGHLAPGMQVLTKPFALDVLTARIQGLIKG